MNWTQQRNYVKNIWRVEEFTVRFTRNSLATSIHASSHFYCTYGNLSFYFLCTYYIDDVSIPDGSIESFYDELSKSIDSSGFEMLKYRNDSQSIMKTLRQFHTAEVWISSIVNSHIINDEWNKSIFFRWYNLNSTHYTSHKQSYKADNNRFKREM